jgi:restriction system protein
MRFELPRNSLFAILLRSPWWASILLAAVVFGAVRIFANEGFAVAFAAPFLVIGMYAAFKQIGRPGPKRIAATLARARALPWDGFRAALEEGFRRDGMTVARTDGGADLELTRERLVTLVACKRWKAVRTGVEPLREFEAATRERGAHARIYVAAGEVTESARKFAEEKRIRLLGEEELVKLLRF